VNIPTLDEMDDAIEGLLELFEEEDSESLADIIKASFGGDRSAAGRYAAEQRWKGHAKSEPERKSGGKKFTSDAKDKEFNKKYGNERQFGDGDCFQAATNLLFDKFAGEPSARICHGVPLGKGKIEGIRFDHGWVEVEEEVGELPDGEKVYDTMVYDYSNGKEMKMPAAFYYHFGEIRSEDVKRFTAEEALTEMKEKGFYGPWD
jgi:hypothetical protein